MLLFANHKLLSKVEVVLAHLLDNNDTVHLLQSLSQVESVLEVLQITEHEKHEDVTAAVLSELIAPFPSVPDVRELKTLLKTPLTRKIPVPSGIPKSFESLFYESSTECVDNRLYTALEKCIFAGGAENNFIFTWDSLLAVPFYLASQIESCSLSDIKLDRNTQDSSSSSLRPDRLVYLHGTLIFKGFQIFLKPIYYH